MAKFKVLETSFIDNHLRQAGDIVDESEIGGEPGPNLEKIKPGKKTDEPKETEEAAS